MNTVNKRIISQRSVLLLIFIFIITDLNPRPALVSAQRTESRPFEMLVLGDSVVWGQGLTEDKKFYTKVKEAISTELGGRQVRQLVKAHSGATISPQKPVACPIEPGEVPIVTPTLLAQVDSALSTYASLGIKPEDVDLVLLNGGINDVTFPIIVNPFTSEKTITKESEKFCRKGMHTLLDRPRLVFHGR